MEGERGARPEEERGDRAEGIRLAGVGLSSVHALLGGQHLHRGPCACKRRGWHMGWELGLNLGV